MIIETIKCMTNNSTWVDNENKNIYKFFNNNDLAINGKNHSHYSINSSYNKIELQMGLGKKYNIEYVNDFILKLSNRNESFRIMPE